MADGVTYQYLYKTNGRGVKGAKCGWHSLHGGQLEPQTVYFPSSLLNRTFTKVAIHHDIYDQKFGLGCPVVRILPIMNEKIVSFLYKM
jgi:hypothetical protein